MIRGTEIFTILWYGTSPDNLAIRSLFNTISFQVGDAYRMAINVLIDDIFEQPKILRNCELIYMVKQAWLQCGPA
jgi:hypothetical protein